MTGPLTPAEGQLRFRERQARKLAPLPPRPVVADEPAPRIKRARQFKPRACDNPLCRKMFTPTGSRSRFCEECR